MCVRERLAPAQKSREGEDNNRLPWRDLPNNDQCLVATLSKQSSKNSTTPRQHKLVRTHGCHERHRRKALELSRVSFLYYYKKNEYGVDTVTCRWRSDQ